MNLIVNLGNSDLRIVSSNEGKIIFRSQSNFKEYLKLLIYAIENSSVTFDSEGKVIGDLFLETPEKVVRVLKLDFFLLKEEIKQIEKFENSKISEITCFITHQEKNGSDTFPFQQLLEGKTGQQIFPNIKFIFVEITFNPTDYSCIVPFYQNYFEDIDVKNIVIAIAQGTPAMCVGLSMASAKKSINVHQFYAKRIEKDESVEVLRFNQFTKQEKEKQISSYLDLMKRGEFLSAIQKIDGTFLEEIIGLKEITNYFINRNNYCFKGALNNLNQVENNKFKKILEYGTYSLKQILNCIGDKDKLNYHFENFPFILKETLNNIRFEFNKGNYFLAMALFTSFMDCLERTIICKGLDLNDMNFSKKTGTYPTLDDYILNNIKMEKIKKNSHLYNSWKYKEGKWNFFLNGPSGLSLIKWINNHNPNAKYATTYLRINKVVSLQDVRMLRNQLPIAHSVASVSKEIILSKLNGFSINEFLNNFDEVLSELFVLNSVPEYFSDYHESLIDIENIVMNY